jgi:hypothetical protein
MVLGDRWLIAYTPLKNNARFTDHCVEQEACALRFLFGLMERDRERRIFTVFLYRPFHGKNTSTPTFTRPYDNFQRIYSIPSALDIGWFVQEEWAAEAGTMAVSRKSSKRQVCAGVCIANGKVCGSPIFERQVRVALRKSPHDIELITSSFQIDENASSQTASFRFCNVPRDNGDQN